MGNDYVTLRLPKELMDLVDKKLIGRIGFTSRAEVAKEAIRRILLIYPREEDNP